MSTVYNNPGYGDYAPPQKVNFGWIGESFELFKANAGVWIVAVLVVALAPAIVGGIIGGIVGASTALSHPPSSTPPFGGTEPPFGGGGGTSPFGGGGTSPFSPGGSLLTGGLPLGLNLAIRIFSLVWTAFFYGGIYSMAVKQVRGQQISFGDIFSGGPYFLAMLGFNILYGLATLVGFILCIIPGFIVIGLLFPAYAMIVDGAGIGDAFSRSMEAMKKDWLTAAGFVFVIFLLMLVSAIPCGLGLLVTMPMYWITSALAYRDMVGMPGGVAAAASGPYYAAPQAGTWPPPPTSGQAPPPYGQQAPPAYGQQAPPPAYGQQPPPPSFGQSPPPSGPTRRSLSGDEIDERGNVIPPPASSPPPDRPNNPPPSAPPPIG